MNKNDKFVWLWLKFAYDAQRWNVAWAAFNNCSLFVLYSQKKSISILWYSRLSLHAKCDSCYMCIVMTTNSSKPCSVIYYWALFLYIFLCHALFLPATVEMILFTMPMLVSVVSSKGSLVTRCKRVSNNVHIQRLTSLRLETLQLESSEMWEMCS